MTFASHPFRWLPPFLVGICAATAAEVPVGLLLYGGPGLMRSLTAVLAVEAAALGFGFLTAPGPRPDLVEALRKRWLFCLVAFLAATRFSAFWSVVEAVGGSALGQGLGLAFLAALPLYATGGLLGAMGTVSGMEPEQGRSGVGGAAALGAALGFAATGASLPQVFTPASLLLVCLVLLSAGGLIYGSVLDARLRVHVRARRPSVFGDVRVEDRHLLSRDRAARLLLEGDHVRRWTTLGDDGGDPWDVVAFRAFLPDGSADGSADGSTHGSPHGSADGSVLFLGGGASPLPRVALWERPTLRMDVVERSHPVVELGREHLETGMYAGADGRLGIWVGNPEDALSSLVGPYALVLVDTAALAPQGGPQSLSARHRSMVMARVGTTGTLVLGPLPASGGAWSFPESWTQRTYTRRLPHGLDDLGVGAHADEELLVGTPRGNAALPLRIDGFVSVAP